MYLLILNNLGWTEIERLLGVTGLVVILACRRMRTQLCEASVVPARRRAQAPEPVGLNSPCATKSKTPAGRLASQNPWAVLPRKYDTPGTTVRQGRLSFTVRRPGTDSLAAPDGTGVEDRGQRALLGAR